MSFKDLQLIEPLLKALHEEGYTSPTPIQEKSIPAILSQKDLLGCAQTGTGKTAAFALPLLQLLAGRKPQHGNYTRSPKALILTPTRELAIQIGENFSAYGRYLSLHHVVIYGGVSQHTQVHALRKSPDILIATPGRLIDLMNQRLLSIDQVSHFVLDEADRMLDMGFIHDVKRIIAKLPRERQTIFFSATMSPEIQQLSSGLLKQPVTVKVTPPATTVDLIQQSLYYVEKQDKRSLLIGLLSDPAVKTALVFTRTKHGADKITRELRKTGIRALAIHGNKSQNARQSALLDFRNGTIRVLVATDIAARGIDIDDMSHVFNYELPNIPETYVHRIGRTGRAGASGTAISFCDPEEKAYLYDIQKLIRKEIPVIKDHAYANEGSPLPLQTLVVKPGASKSHFNNNRGRQRNHYRQRA